MFGQLRGRDVAAALPEDAWPGDPSPALPASGPGRGGIGGMEF